MQVYGRGLVHSDLPYQKWDHYILEFERFLLSLILPVIDNLCKGKTVNQSLTAAIVYPDRRQIWPGVTKLEFYSKSQSNDYVHNERIVKSMSDFFVHLHFKNSASDRNRFDTTRKVRRCSFQWLRKFKNCQARTGVLILPHQVINTETNRGTVELFCAIRFSPAFLSIHCETCC